MLTKARQSVSLAMFMLSGGLFKTIGCASDCDCNGVELASGSPDPRQNSDGQAGAGTDACGGVHGTEEEPSFVHDPSTHRPLTAH